jgi:hypothetical protein
MRILVFVCLLWLGINCVALAQNWEKIIDDGDAGYAETGNAWASWNHSGSIGGSYRYLSHHGKGLPRVGTATWQVNIPHTGQYEVSVHFRATENRTTDADYFVYDVNNKRHHFVLDQKNSPSGWHRLGVFSWNKGQVARVILDGTDDNQSDEADAVRWRLVSQEPPPPPPPPPTQGCESDTPGQYTMIRYAESVQSQGDWSNPSHAANAPDQKEAHSPNVDPPDQLLASQFSFCTPQGKFEITKVKVGVLGRMQYDRDQYKLIMFWESAGKRFTFSQTRALWVWGDITSARNQWSIADLQNLTIRLGLDQHPGGKRDSDAWIDAFAIEVNYVIHPPQCPAGQVRCNDRCVNIQTSSEHCGACNRKCTATQTCSGGNCSQICPVGMILCQQRCIDPLKDPDHCGKCNNSCNEDQTCITATCSTQCPKQEQLCNGKCRDTTNDAAHCGACNRACAAEERCEASRCVKIIPCPANLSQCPDKCADLNNDPQNCGKCGVMCGVGVNCQQGQCAAPVPAPEPESHTELEPPTQHLEIPAQYVDSGEQTAPPDLPQSMVDSIISSDTPKNSNADTRFVTHSTACFCNGYDYNSIPLESLLVVAFFLMLFLVRRGETSI